MSHEQLTIADVEKLAAEYYYSHTIFTKPKILGSCRPAKIATHLTVWQCHSNDEDFNKLSGFQDSHFNMHSSSRSHVD